jgi:hypothetical protein
VLQQNYIGNRGSKFQISDSSKEILHGLTLKIEQGKELQFTVPMDLEKQPSFVFYLDCCIPPLGLCTSMMTFRKINLKAIPLANRQYHSWGNTF